MMGKVIVVTSGKGGVGKTTSTAALGAALAQRNEKVVVVDFDVGLRNLDLVMGAERRVVYDLINVIQGDAKLTQALIRDKRLETLFLLPASQTRDKDNLTAEGVERVINDLKRYFDWIICDSPAGIERGATLAMRHADVAVVVTNPEVSSVRDSDRIIGLLDAKTAKAERGERMEKHLLLTPLRRQSRRTRRHAQGRRRPGDPVHPAPRHHTRKHGCSAGIQHRCAGYAGRQPQRGCDGLFRRRSPARRRDGADRDPRGKEEYFRQDLRTEGGMNIFRLFNKQRTAPAARERLQVLLAHERSSAGSDLVSLLREEILAVIAKHVQLDHDKVQVTIDRNEYVSTLEIDVEIPLNAAVQAA
ncbi:septum site-determining protein MinD/cell division topological specificity factor MinE [Rhizobium leguminosarum]